MQRNRSPVFEVRSSMFWWTPNIDKLRKACQAANERFLSIVEPDAIAVERLMTIKTRLSRAIKANKDESFH
ncbi:reverse transcriptase [Anopheles sinensis]|uniref:Reverse transcriptase n=1 Tax=Anopheles sinensis TaxID=74873 RepID=A0A084VDJ0_ANOSI|nr:reverse transcriptase [Anopheles sinensis]